jgi:ATPase subunit of ABC transporter with duplicated ATPase domains
VDGAAYEPRRIGNRAFALATQNPDHQWCGATLAEDLARRHKALAGYREFLPPSDALLRSLAGKLGVRAPDQHLCDLPLAARKRLSWLWPLSGAMPWLMLDEPTIGQDRPTRIALAAVIARMCDLGYGVVLVTHDDDFAAQVPHQPLRIEDLAIRSG